MPVLVATGCSSGLGLAALALFAHRLLRVSLDAPWRILAGSRSGAQTYEQRTLTDLCRQHPAHLELTWLPLDLARSDSVRSFARAVQCRVHERIDALVLNAAVWNVDPVTVRAGPHDWNEEAVVNALSQHLLVDLLTPLLASTPKPSHRSRIVVTTSKLHSTVSSVDDLVALLHPPPPTATPTSTSGKARYAASKVLQLLSAAYLAHKLAPQGIEVVAVSPGFVPTTNLSRAHSPLQRWVMRNLVSWLPFAVSETEGAARIARCFPLVAAPGDDALAAVLAADPTHLLYLTRPATAPLPDPAAGATPALGGVAQLLVEEAAQDGWDAVARTVLGGAEEGFDSVRRWEWGGAAAAEDNVD